MERGMLTTGEVARALGVTINTVKAWARAGRLDIVVLPSGHHRVPRRELSRLVEEGRSSGRAARFRARRRAWSEFERWHLEQGVDDVSTGEALRWIESALDAARIHGPLPEPDPEETAGRVARFHRILSHAGT